jgi:hypothetical protein
MLLNNTVYIIKSDENKYLVIYNEPSEFTHLYSLEDREDNPMEHYHLNGRKISVQLMSFGTTYKLKQIIKVFSNYQTAIEYISTIGIMQ